MRGAVPLARRMQFHDRRRAAVSVLAITAALALVLVTSALFAGFHAQETAYLDRSPADVLISQAGVRTMQLTMSNLPASAEERARSVAGVAWVEPLRQLTTTVQVPSSGQLVSYVFGVPEAGRHGGPQQLADGRWAGAGEAVVDRGGARQLGIGIGDHIELFGRALRVVGLSDGLTSLANTTVFIDAREFADLAGPGTNYLLVAAADGIDPDELAARLADVLPDVTVQTRDAFAAQEAALVRDMYTDVIRAMQGVGIVVAFVLVALCQAGLTSANLRSLAVVKALGAPPEQLTLVVVAQAAWVILIAATLATASVALLSTGIGAVAPNVALSVEPGAVAMTLGAALVVGIPAAAAPVRRVRRLDPAVAFRAS